MKTIRLRGTEYLAGSRKGKPVPVEFESFRAAKIRAEELGPEWIPVLRSQYATYADLSLPESQRSGSARVARVHDSEAVLAAQKVPEAKTLDELLRLHGYPSYSQIRDRDDDDDEETHLRHMKQIEDRTPRLLGTPLREQRIQPPQLHQLPQLRFSRRCRGRDHPVGPGRPGLHRQTKSALVRGQHGK